MFDPLLFTAKLRRVVWFPVYSSLHRQHTTRKKRYKAQKILYRVRKRRLLLALYLFCRSCMSFELSLIFFSHSFLYLLFVWMPITIIVHLTFSKEIQIATIGQRSQIFTQNKYNHGKVFSGININIRSVLFNNN